MIVDSSALLAILREEPEAPACTKALELAAYSSISAATYLETAIVVDSNRDPILSRRLDELIARAHLVIEPVTEQQARLAREAYRDFGKGSGHPAQLNFGDCFAYALSKHSGQPLLFKGRDFIHTDVKSALAE
jgi:ribonuclease VapC